MDKDIQNRTSTFCTRIPPALSEKSLANFGSLITEIKQRNCTHPNRLFGRPYFNP